jgi:hypothetical protein
MQFLLSHVGRKIKGDSERHRSRELKSGENTENGFLLLQMLNLIRIT